MLYLFLLRQKHTCASLLIYVYVRHTRMQQCSHQQHVAQHDFQVSRARPSDGSFIYLYFIFIF